MEVEDYLMAKAQNKISKEVTKAYEPTEAEAVQLAAIQARKDAKPTVPKVTLKMDGGVGQMLIEHRDVDIGNDLALAALGGTDWRYGNSLLTQIINMVPRKDGVPNQQAMDFAISAVMAMEPKDEIEGMLAAQMVAVHMATMTFANRLAGVENLDQQNSVERAFNKLTRTFTTQMEALNRYRGKGQQKMTVEHIHVHEGGQAIVGNVKGGGGNDKNRE